MASYVIFCNVEWDSSMGNFEGQTHAYTACFSYLRAETHPRVTALPIPAVIKSAVLNAAPAYKPKEDFHFFSHRFSACGALERVDPREVKVVCDYKTSHDNLTAFQKALLEAFVGNESDEERAKAKRFMDLVPGTYPEDDVGPIDFSVLDRI